MGTDYVHNNIQSPCKNQGGKDTWFCCQQLVPLVGERIDITLSLPCPTNLKWGIGPLFDPCVNAMGRWPYCSSRMEVSYCTFGFDAISWRYLRTLSLPRDSPRDNQYVCRFEFTRERQLTL